MGRTKSLITLCLLSLVLLAPGIGRGQEPSKSPFEAIQIQLSTVREENLILKEQISKLNIDVNQILFSYIKNQLESIQAQLANLPPTWSRKLPASERFVVLAEFNDGAVLDLETGLVWERSPSLSTFDWYMAQMHCNDLILGNRKGWRLPTIQELASLVDPSVPEPGPTLPAGHPFQNVQSPSYWSATTAYKYTSSAWHVTFSNGAVWPENNHEKRLVWCVRGGQGVDPQ